MSVHRRLMMQRYGLEHTTFLYSPVVFDPIFTPIFTAALGAGGLGFGAGAVSFLAPIASAIATTALGILLTPGAPKPPKPEDGKVPKTQSIPYRSWAVGRVRVGGSYMLWEAKGRNLIAVQAVTGHRISAYRGFWLHDNRIDLTDLDANGFTNFGSGERYGNNVRIMTRRGLPTETAYTPITDILSTGGVWTSNHRGDGQASLGMIVQSVDAQNQQKRFPYGARCFLRKLMEPCVGTIETRRKARQIPPHGHGRGMLRSSCAGISASTSSATGAITRRQFFPCSTCGRKKPTFATRTFRLTAVASRSVTNVTGTKRQKTARKLPPMRSLQPAMAGLRTRRRRIAVHGRQVPGKPMRQPDRCRHRRPSDSA